MIGVLTAGSAAVPFEGINNPFSITASAATTSQIEQLKSDVQTIASHINRISYLSYYKSTNTKSVVMAYQRTINLLDNAGLVVDGIFGNASLRATKNFQSRNGLTVDGMVGVGTLRVIQTKANAYIDANTPKAATVAFSSMVSPSIVMQGNSFNLGGTISSSGAPISSFTGEILLGNTVVMSKTVYPNAYSVNIRNSAVNTSLAFGKLNPSSSYVLRYTATAGGTTKTYTQSFTVQAKKATISFDSMSTPSSISQGKSFSLSGTIKTTNQPIYSITAQITNSSNSAIMSKTVYPNSYSYVIKGSTLDVAMKFSSLTTSGNYALVYNVTAADGTTSSKTYSFTVNDTSPVINVSTGSSANASKLIQAAYADIGKTSAQMGFPYGDDWCAYSVGKWLKSCNVNLAYTASVNNIAEGLVGGGYSSTAYVFKDTRGKFTNGNLYNLYGSGKVQRVENRYDVVPEPGDIICFRWSNSSYENYSHVGMVVSYDPATKRIVTIEGNVGSSASTSTVKLVERPFDSTVVAIVRMK